MKHLLTIFICLICAQQLNAQSLTLYDIDASSFPVMKAKFYAFDAAGEPYNPTLGELSLTENGIPQTITNVTCSPTFSPKPISSVLDVDVSSSMLMKAGSIARIEVAKKVTALWVNGLSLGTSECAVVSFDSSSYLNQDFTTDRTKLLNAISQLKPLGGTDYNAGFLFQNGGSLLVSKAAKHTKVIVFLTDGISSGTPDVAAIVNEAKRQNCVIYCITFGIAAPQSLIDIAKGTGGEFYENLSTLEEAEDLYRRLLYMVLGGLPCEVTWTSTEICKSEDRTVDLKWGSKTSRKVDKTPGKALASLEVKPSFISFGNRVPLTVKDTTVTLTARNFDFTVTSIPRKFGSADFTVIGTSFPLFIPKNTSKTITLRFVPADSTIKYTSFGIITDKCPASVSASGGYIGKKMQVSTLKLTVPNGGEIFVVGSDTLITWEGISEMEEVTLEYSKDNGLTWNTITNQATGLNYIWKNIPMPTSTKCLIRIRQQGVSTGDVRTGTISLGGHSQGLNTVVYSPDGLHAVTISQDNTAKIWDVKTGNLVYNLAGHTAEVKSVAYSPDGSKIITGSLDKTAKLWDANSGIVLNNLIGHTEEIFSVAYSGDGSKVVTGGSDNTVKVWNANTGALIHDLKGHTSYINSVAFSPDSKRIASGSWDRTAKIWNVNTGAVIFTLAKHFNYVWNVAFSPDGKRLVTSSNDASAKIWDMGTGQLLHDLILHSEFVNTAVFGPDGSLVATSSNDGTAKIWDANTGAMLQDLEGHKQPVTCIAFSPDGSRVVTGSGDLLGKIWDVKTGALIRDLKEHEAGITGVMFSPSGAQVATSSYDHTAKLWNVGSPLLQEDTSDAVFSIVKPTPSGQDVDMKQCFVGSAKDSLIETCVHNTGMYPFKVNSISFTGVDAAEFEVVSGLPPFTVPASGTYPVEFRFRPASIGNKSAQILLITSSDTVRQSIIGEGIEPVLAVVGNSIDFGQVVVNTERDTSQAQTVKNIGSTALTITKISHSGPNDIDFTTLSANTNLQLQPGETARLDLRFAPKDIGRTSGRLMFEYNGTGSPAVIQLFGEGVLNKGQIIASGSNVPVFTCETEKIDTLRLQNTGRTVLQIHSAIIGGLNPIEFQFVTPFTAATLAPDSTLLLPYRFVPASSGNRSATVEFKTNSPTDSLYTVTLSGRKEIADFAANVPILDIGVLCPNEGKDTVITLTNIGTVRNVFKSQSANLILGTSSIPLIVSESKPLSIRFNGQAAEGAINEILTITDSICGTQKSIQIIGSVQIPKLIPAPLADFGGVGGGSFATMEVVAVNKDSRPIVIGVPQGIAVPFTLVSLTPPAGSVLMPNDTVKAIIRYDAVTGMAGGGHIIWSVVQPCATVDSTELRGQGTQPDNIRTAISVQGITAQAGEQVSLVLKLMSKAGLERATITDWTARISYNKTILFNEQTGNVCASGTDDSCVIELSGVYNNSDTLISVPCIATLGNTDNSTLRIDEFKWANSNIITQTNDGTMHITGICDDGGVRLFIAAENAKSLTTRPNPAQTAMQIRYGLREPLTVTLELLNVTGQTVQTIMSNQPHAAGEYSITDDMSLVGNGVYSLRLTTGKGVITTRVDVVR